MERSTATVSCRLKKGSCKHETPSPTRPAPLLSVESLRVESLRVESGKGIGVRVVVVCDETGNRAAAHGRRTRRSQNSDDMTMSMYLTPTPKPPQNSPTAPQGVAPIGKVACSVINLSLYCLS